MWRLRLAVTLFMLFSAAGARAASYYVAVGGSDTNAGSQADPFATVQHALTLAGAGDTVTVAEGSYEESLRISRGGSPAAKLVLTAQGAVSVLPPPSDPSSKGISIAASHVRVEGFDIAGFDVGLVVEPGVSDVVITNAALHSNGTGILINEAGPVVVEDSSFRDNCADGARIVGFAASITLRGVEATGNGISCGLKGDGIYVSPDAFGVVIEDSLSQANGGDGFDVGSALNILRRIVAVENGDHGVRLEQDTTVDSSLVTDNAKVGIEVSGNEQAQVVLVASTVANQPIALLLGPAGQPLVVSLSGNILAAGGKVIEYQDSVDLTEDYNLLFRPSAFLPHIVRKQGSTTVASYSGNDISNGRWTSESGEGLHSVVGNPLFVGAGLRPYGLQAVSPAVDAGPPFGFPAQDLSGVPRPFGAGVDMGAFERQGGTTFYVSPGGSDLAPGTAAQPFRNISHAAGIAGPGDSVVIAAGSYRESVTLTVSGMSGAPIAFTGEPGVDLVSPVSDPVGGADGIVVESGVGFITLSGFRMVSGFRRGVHLRTGAHDISLATLELSGNGTGILVEGASGITIDDVYAHDNCSHGVAVTLAADSVVIRDSISDDNGFCSPQGDGFHADIDSAKVKLQRCSATGNNGDGFDIRGDQTDIWRSVARGNQRNGLKLAGGGKVEDCLSAGNVKVGLELVGDFAGATLRVSSSTFADNSIGLLLGPARQPAAVYLVNNVVAGAGKPLEYQDTVTLSEDYNLFFRDVGSLPHIIKKQGGTQLAAYNAAAITSGAWIAAGGGSQTLAADPRFIAAGADAYQLRLDSPALDSGLAGEAPAVDLLGIERPQLGEVDRGAYERPDGLSLTYYVAPSGGDTPKGDAADPFSSINAALGFAAPGDTVVVLPGTYAEEVTITGGGLPGSELTLIGDQGQARLLGSGKGVGIHFASGAGNVRIEGFTVEHFDTGILLDRGTEQVTLSGVRAIGNDSAGIYLNRASNIVVEDADTSDNCRHGIDIAAGSGNISISSSISARNGVSCSRASDGFHASSHAADVIFNGCQAEENRGDGFDVRGPGVILSGVWARDNGDRGIKTEQAATVENALMTGNKVGIELTGAFTGGALDVKNSTIYGNGTYGILIGAGRRQVSATIINNIIAGTAKGLEYQQSSSLVEHHNIFSRTPGSNSHIVHKNGSLTLRRFNAGDINSGSWAAYSGQGEATRALDPQFAAVAVGDFSLRSDSPAVDAGDNSIAPGFDIFGARRPLGAAVDLGAIERPEPTSLYVAPAGSDQNSGTVQAPFATLQRAADLAGAGYEIVVQPGVYHQRLVISSSGTVDEPIVFRFEAGARLEPPAGIIQPTAVRITGSSSHIELTGVEIGPGFDRGIWAETGASDLVITAVSVSGAGEGILLDGVDNVTLDDSLVEKSCVDGVRVKGISSGISIRKTRTLNSGTSCAGNARGFYVDNTVSLVALQMCEARGNTGSGFDLRGSAIELLNSIAVDNGNVGIRSSGTTRVENVLVVDNANVGVVSTGAAASIEVINSTVAENGGGVLIADGTANVVNTIVAGPNKTFEYQVGASITEHHNIFYRTVPAAAHVVVKSGKVTVATYNAADINGGRWASESGQGVETVAADPAFGSAAIGVYTLRAFSPGVDTGSLLEAPGMDIAGNIRPLGPRVDKGAYERAPGGGAAYVVSPDGSDAAGGTEASPFQTLARALSEAGPGDTIRLRAGTYSEVVAIPFGGLPGAPLVIEAEAGAVLVSPDPGQKLVGLTVAGAVSDLEIRGLGITGGFDKGIWVQEGASAVVLGDLDVHGNQDGVVLEGASKVVVDGGDFSSNCTAGLRIIGSASQIKIRNTSSASNGVACGHFGSGFIVGADVDGLELDGATARDNSQNGFDVKASNTLFSGTIAAGNGNIGMRIEHDARAENVLVTGNGNVGIVVTASDTSGASIDLRNGTIARNTVGILAGASIAGPVSLSMVNCIIEGTGKLLEYQSSAAVSGHHNLYYRFPGTASHIVLKDGATTLSRYDAADINGGLWQAESGQGSGSIADDPRFIDGDAGLFWLRADSPAVDSGSATEAPLVDFLGRGRPLGAEVDRGVYERSSRGGDTYYVALGGSDLNEGSAEQPYASLQRALDLSAPGDRIVVRAGSYMQGARVEVGGDEAGTITIQGEAGAILEGSYPGASAEAIAIAPGVGFIELKDLTVQGGWDTGVLVEAGSHDIRLSGSTIRGNQQGIVLKGALRVDVDDITTEDNCGAGIALEGGTADVVVRNLVSRRNGPSCGDLSEGLFADGSTLRLTVENSTFEENSGGGLDLRGRESRVGNVIAHGNNGSGLRVDDGLVENCLTYSNGGSGIVALGREDGADITIRNCTAHDNQYAVRLGEAVRNNVLSATLFNTILSGSSALLEVQQSVSLVADHNLYFRTNAFMTHILVKDFWRTVASYNASDINSGVWNSVTGQGQGSRSGNPLFVDPESGLFELHQASLAVDQGLSSAAPATDLKGIPRPQGPAADIGALEHVPCLLGGSVGCSPLPPSPPPPGGSERISFVARHDPSVGSAPMGGALADFNLDGHLDVAVTNSDDDTVSVLFGNGEGSFSDIVTFPVGVRPRALAAGDLNGDGKPDLAVANQTSDDVYIINGDGTGNFTLQQRLSANQAPVGVAAGDLSGDGLDDLVVVNLDSNDASVFINPGGGSFGRPTNYRTGSGPLYVAIGDLNADGRPDLAVANRKTDDVSVLLGDGAGRFGLPVHYPAGDANRSVAIGDLDGDGNVDLVVASRLSNGASVLFGDGSGQFSAAMFIATGLTPNSVAVADFNQDGAVDFVVADTGEARVSIVTSAAAGGFSAPASFVTGKHPSTVLLGDLDEDGQVDLVTVNRESGTVTVLTGNGLGGVEPVSRAIATGLGPATVVTGDIDGDGELDAVVSNADGASLTIIHSLNQTGASSTISLPGSRPQGVVLVDFNGDDILDLAVSDEVGNRVALMVGDGVGFSLTGFVAVQSRPVGIVAADFNQDGMIDLVVANSGSRRLSVLLGQGNGNFTTAASVRVGSVPHRLAVLDVNQDGILDVGVIHKRSRSLYLRLGNGDGTFRRGRGISAGKLPSGIVKADFNGDNQDDLAVANYRSNSISVMTSRGRGRFRRKTKKALRTASGITAADFDGDGKMDLAVTSERLAQVGIYLGDGLGGFELAATYASGLAPRDIRAADVNLDGKPDLIVVNRDSATLSLLINDSP